MKALEKDRTRRYESASALASDLKRHLNDEPVQACPPSVRYRFQKFARRNRTMLTMGALVVAALVVGTVDSVWLAYRANEKARLAKQEENRALIHADIEKTTRELMMACWRDLMADEPEQRAKVHAILGKATKKIEAGLDRQPLVDSALRLALAKMYLSIYDTTNAQRALEQAEGLLDSVHDDSTGLAAKQREELNRLRMMCGIQQLGLPIGPPTLKKH
jgi:hypothetical protein